MIVQNVKAGEEGKKSRAKGRYGAGMGWQWSLGRVTRAVSVCAVYLQRLASVRTDKAAHKPNPISTRRPRG